MGVWYVKIVSNYQSKCKYILLSAAYCKYLIMVILLRRCSLCMRYVHCSYHQLGLGFNLDL